MDSFLNLSAAFLNITPQPDMLQISLFGKEIPVIMPKKKDKFYTCILWITNRYDTIKSHKENAHTGFIMLILKLQENSPGCHAVVFISRLTYISFWLLNLQVFSMFFTLFFVPHVLFYIFHLGKLLLSLNTLIVVPVNLNFFLI